MLVGASGGAQVGRGLDRALHRLRALFGTELQPLGDDEFQLGHTDEAEHGAKAASLGGTALPAPVRLAMRLTSRLMTRGSYWL